MKAIVYLLIALILYCLGSGLIYLVRDKAKSTRLVKALSWRIGLSLLLFFFLYLTYFLGWVQPHGI